MADAAARQLQYEYKAVRNLLFISDFYELLIYFIMQVSK